MKHINRLWLILLLCGFSYSQEYFVTTGWTPNREPELSHYVMYRDTVPGTMNYIATISKDDSIYTDVAVQAGKTYYYKLTAADDAGLESAPSNEVMATVGAVTWVEDKSTNIPEKIELKQNYPNPFNPTTTIEYSLPERSYVTLTIYNVLGKEIRTLSDGYKDAGIYKVEWDGRDINGNIVSSGVYFYQLMAENFVKVKKSIYQK